MGKPVKILLKVIIKCFCTDLFFLVKTSQLHIQLAYDQFESTSNILDLKYFCASYFWFKQKWLNS